MSPLKSFHFNNSKELLLSMTPSAKYGLLKSWLSVAGLLSVLEMLIGLKALTLFAFSLMLAMELITGILAARVKRERIQSNKLSRFLLKLTLWLICLFIVHSFEKEYRNKSDVVAALYEWLHQGIIIYVSGEYLISVIENIAVISGHSSAWLIVAIKTKIKNFFGVSYDEAEQHTEVGSGTTNGSGAADADKPDELQPPSS